MALDKEKMKAYSKAYYKTNKEKLLAYDKAWKEANPEKVKAYEKAYRKANPEKGKDYNKKNTENLSFCYIAKSNNMSVSSLRENPILYESLKTLTLIRRELRK